MAGSERAGRRGVLLGAAMVLSLAASDCGEFAHTNPFDPAVAVKITVTGPDSAFAQFDTLHFAITTDPVYDYADVEWQLSGLQKIDNNGNYRVGPTETYGGRPARVTVAVRVDSRMASKSVDVVFPPAGIRVRTCRTNLRDVVITSLGLWIDVCVSLVDARGGVISTNSESPPATVRVLNTSVASAGQFSRTVTAVGNGTTGVIYSYGPWADTLTITVRQVVAYVTVSPTACKPVDGRPMMMAVGDTLRLALGAPVYDLAYQPITDTARIQAAIPDLRWELVQYQGSVAAQVSPDGLVTAVSPGYVLLGARFPASPASQFAASCNIGVQ